MPDPFVGEVRLFSYNFAPKGWLECAGQELPIAGNPALYSLLGTVYGGNGSTTFGLPDLRGRVPVHAGRGQLRDYVVGESGGVTSVTLQVEQIPAHRHAVVASASDAGSRTPEGQFYANGAGGVLAYGAPAARVPLASATVGSTGGGQPHTNLAPYLGVMFCIATTGIYPIRE